MCSGTRTISDPCSHAFAFGIPVLSKFAAQRQNKSFYQSPGPFIFIILYNVLFHRQGSIMKFTTIVAANLAGANVAVLAKSCKQGGVYCGQSLLNRGEWNDYPKGRGWPYDH